MNRFEKHIPANINTIRNETIPILFKEEEIGSCTLRAEGYTLIGSYDLKQDIDFDIYEFQYRFIGGGLVGIIIARIEIEV